MEVLCSGRLSLALLWLDLVLRGSISMYRVCQPLALSAELESYRLKLNQSHPWLVMWFTRKTRYQVMYVKAGGEVNKRSVQFPTATVQAWQTHSAVLAQQMLTYGRYLYIDSSINKQVNSRCQLYAVNTALIAVEEWLPVSNFKHFSSMQSYHNNKLAIFGTKRYQGVYHLLLKQRYNIINISPKRAFLPSGLPEK